MENNDRMKWEIVEHLGTISESKNHWTREVNIVSWNGREPKLDIRSWDPTHERMDRGSGTFTNEEAKTLSRILNEYYGGANK
uniref:Seryl-tRNA synthetase-like protein n=1 Tax=uncultured bacterium Contig643 TaxID=1393602 RepID=W0FH87_9BACT|nr:seryl-tRNA synthetase-like protein [uncultured bacterium Contig643]